MTDTTEAHETAGATTRLLLEHVRAVAGESAVAAVVERAGVPWTAEELVDIGRWFSYDTRVRLFDAATEILDDPTTMFTVGAQAVSRGTAHYLAAFMRAVGSPQDVFRQLPRMVKKFTATSTMTVVACDAESATLRYRLHDGYRHSRLDCQYAQGLFSAVPGAFGLPRAEVVHDECESDGYPACVYRVTWRRYRRFFRRPLRVAPGLEIAGLRAQLHELQRAASDLVDSHDIGTVLDRITDRAVAAVLAPAYLLVVEDPQGGGTVVRSSGLSAEREAALAAQLERGEDLGPWAVVADVASARRHHGQLAALYGSGHESLAEDLPLLQAYARHAAAALDLLTALEESRREERRASTLLTLAHDLAIETDQVAVAERIASAIPGVVGCDTATVLLWEPQRGAMVPVASVGYPDEVRAVLLGVDILADQVPELVDLLTHHVPLPVDAEDASPGLRAILDVAGAETVIAVPLLSGDLLMGAAVAGWDVRGGGAGAHAEALARMLGVCDQGATALQNARLLETVRHQSRHDALTGLPNRADFGARLEEALRRAGPESATAVLFCDLDRFKHVNDGLGHAAGDEMLRQVAGRMRGQLRDDDVVGRLGGDEFGVLLADVEDENLPVAVAHRIVEELDQSFRIAGHDLRTTISVGVAVHMGPEGRGDRLLAAADAAMYIAKRSGRNQVAVAGKALARRVAPSLEAELAQAPAAGQLRLFYQPVVDISGPEAGTVVGAEALLRWAHPRLGMLAPGAFLPLAEEAGLVAELDLWALDAACRAWTAWPRGPHGPLHVAVNLATATLVRSSLIPAVRAAVNQYGVPSGVVRLEVVESRSLADLPGVIDHLAELRQLGTEVSLDDFGTGFSTLTWLQALPVDQVKIDRSFISALPEHGPSLAVVRGVLALARELGIGVVAEGVETPEQLATLRSVGCDLVQGYLLGRPAPELNLAQSLHPALGATARVRR